MAQRSLHCKVPGKMLKYHNPLFQMAADTGNSVHAYKLTFGEI